MQIDVGYRPAHSMARIQLAPGEAIMAESGAMIGMSPNVQMTTGMSQNSGGGLLGGLMAGFKRALAGESWFRNTFTATNGPAAGIISTNIGVSQSGTEPASESSLGLTGGGGGAAGFTWTEFAGITHSPGQPNDGQTFVIPVLPPQGLGFDNLDVTFLTDNDLDGLPDATDMDDDNDSQADSYETAFGTDPLNAASRFSPVLARVIAPPGLELLFPGAPGVIYTVQTSETLGAWQDLSTHTGAGQPIVVPLPMAEPKMFFRVKAGGP